MASVAIKIGRRQGARSGAYQNRYAIDEQRGRRPIFIATLRATASWLFFCVARSSRMNLHMLVAPALKNNQLTSGGSHAIPGTGHIGSSALQSSAEARQAVLQGRCWPRPGARSSFWKRRSFLDFVSANQCCLLVPTRSRKWVGRKKVIEGDF